MYLEELSFRFQLNDIVLHGDLKSQVISNECEDFSSNRSVIDSNMLIFLEYQYCYSPHNELRKMKLKDIGLCITRSNNIASSISPYHYSLNLRIQWPSSIFRKH